MNPVLLTMLFVLLIGAGSLIAWFYFFSTSNKKVSWEALIFQPSDSILPPVKDNEGKIISDIKLNELEPYGVDTLVKEKKNSGAVIYRLVRMNKTVSEVTADNINNFKKYDASGRVYVEVLYKDGSCTLLRSGYDAQSGSKVWSPMPYDQSTSMMNDHSIAARQFEDKEKLYTKLLTYAFVVIAVIFLLASISIMGKTLIYVSDKVDTIDQRHQEFLEKFYKINEQTNNDLGPQPIKISPPTIE